MHHHATRVLCSRTVLPQKVLRQNARPFTFQHTLAAGLVRKLDQDRSWQQHTQRPSATCSICTTQAPRRLRRQAARPLTITHNLRGKYRSGTGAPQLTRPRRVPFLVLQPKGVGEGLDALGRVAVLQNLLQLLAVQRLGDAVQRDAPAVAAAVSQRRGRQVLEQRRYREDGRQRGLRGGRPAGIR